LHAVFLSFTDQFLKLVQGAQLGVYGIVAAFGRPNGIRTARIVRTSLQGIIAPLAIAKADRMNRRHVQHVKSHVAYGRQAFDHIGKAAMPASHRALRAREKLVPTGKSGLAPVDRQKMSRRAYLEWSIVSRGHRFRQLAR